MKPIKYVNLTQGRVVSLYAWRFTWRRKRRFLRLHPEAAAVNAAERILASW